MPPYVTVPLPILYGQGGASFLGAAYNPFTPGASGGGGLNSLKRHPEIGLQRLEERQTLRAQFDNLRHDIDHSGMMEGMDTFTQQAVNMVSGQAAYEAFRLDKEPKSVRERYGKASV